SSRRKDLVLDALADGADAVLRVEDWLVEEKELGDSVESVDNLFAGRLLAETEKAYLFTTVDASIEEDPDADEPGTDWVPKSQSRVYVAAGDSDDVGEQRGHASLDDF
ncbi:MAG: hypothetical protein SV760_00025, partial [Halobacteria archaeon]|nr:hypothetical protein [Halobacteria archaeon]